MQLLIILALLLYGGGSGKNMLSEMRPVLESLGGEEIKEALKSADEISQALSAVQTFADGINAQTPANRDDAAEKKQPAIAFPLAPIANIADRDITYSLSKYFGETQI